MHSLGFCLDPLLSHTVFVSLSCMLLGMHASVFLILPLVLHEFVKLPLFLSSIYSLLHLLMVFPTRFDSTHIKFVQQIEKLRTTVVTLQTNYIALIEKLLSYSKHSYGWLGIVWSINSMDFTFYFSFISGVPLCVLHLPHLCSTQFDRICAKMRPLFWVVNLPTKTAFPKQETFIY